MCKEEEMRKDKFDFKLVDKKWQLKWEEKSLYHRKLNLSLPKYYILDMFPYPSANGLHVGHPEGYTASDICSRYYSMKGFNVLHPMGWDAFGLPTENYALKMKIHPKNATESNIKNFKRQIKRFGFSYDWTREINTSDPSYHKWTQWIFLKLFENGLAYETYMPINWCPSCKTGLANEEVNDGSCDRCGAKIERKKLRQWMLRITSYAQRLLDDLEPLDWPEKIKVMQRNWIGKSMGAEIEFKVCQTSESLFIYTTRPDTIFGATYMVLAPEHPLLLKITQEPYCSQVRIYQEKIKSKSDLERTSLSKDKSGVFTGLFAFNPANGKEIPIYTADYVLMGYGTGAIMAVPAHDQRDYEFAKEHKLSILPVIQPINQEIVRDCAFEGEGVMINSREFSGLKSILAKDRMIQWIEDNGIGKKSIQFKLRDWVFSRQRFWGEPIPIIHCKTCGIVPLREYDLPLLLPDVDHYETSGTGESPLATLQNFVETTCPSCGKPAKRETNTMPQWAGSSWYYLRYIDPHNESFIASKEAIDYWLPVDLYIGGAEHAVLHLLYARFWHKFLYDIGIVPTSEPFLKLRNQGMVLAEDGHKMSKSLGNVINPDDVLDQYGADVVRLYEMFMGPFDQESIWNTQGIEGVNRFLGKIWSIFEPMDIVNCEPDEETNILLHKTIKKVTEDIENFSFNTGISAMMIFINHLIKKPQKPKLILETFLLLVAPYAPHLAEELWEMLGHKTSIFYEKWPCFDPMLVKDKMVEIPVQVNGKLRDKIIVPENHPEETIRDLVMSLEKVIIFMEGKTIRKWIYIPNRTINIVV
jgi:leucyl-tRNA synthetase